MKRLYTNPPIYPIANIPNGDNRNVFNPVVAIFLKAVFINENPSLINEPIILNGLDTTFQIIEAIFLVKFHNGLRIRPIVLNKMLPIPDKILPTILIGNVIIDRPILAIDVMIDPIVDNTVPIELITDPTKPIIVETAPDMPDMTLSMTDYD